VSRFHVLCALMLALATASCGATPTVQQRAALLVEKGQTSEAARVLQEHVAAHPDALAEQRLLIRVLGALGDLGRARRAAEQLAARIGSTRPEPWLELGHAYELSHAYDEALAFYDRAASVAPRDPVGPRTAGLRAARWGEVEVAAPRLEEALRRDPRDAKVWHALGLVRMKLGDTDGARVAYTSGLKADPAALENRVGLASLAVLLGDARGALTEYERLLAARPSLADAHLGRSWALIQLGRYAEAERVLALAADLGADRAVLQTQRRLLARLRRPRESN
jgi:Flp pilus assembly protein TadD